MQYYGVLRIPPVPLKNPGRRGLGLHGSTNLKLPWKHLKHFKAPKTAMHGLLRTVNSHRRSYITVLLTQLIGNHEHGNKHYGYISYLTNLYRREELQERGEPAFNPVRVIEPRCCSQFRPPFGQPADDRYRRNLGSGY